MANVVTFCFGIVALVANCSGSTIQNGSLITKIQSVLDKLDLAGGYCRFMELGYIAYDEYLDQAFTRCYTHIFWDNGNEYFKLWWQTNCSLTFGFPDPRVITLLQLSVNNENDLNRWIQCWQDAMTCCQRHIVNAIPPEDHDFCPATWDGLQCWDTAEASTDVTGSCPEFYYPHCPYHGYSYSRKRCLQNGTWLKYMDECRGFPKEWTNYSECSSAKTDKLRKTRIILRDVMFAVTIATAVPAVIIFLSYRKLRSQKNIIHINFLVSLVASSLLFILYDVFVSLNVIENTDLMTPKGEHYIGCVILTVVVHKYVRLTNYAWMLCEGFYLHKLIVDAFARQKNLVVFYCVGWGLPLIPVVAYTVMRAITHDYNKGCWIELAGRYEWIVNSIILGAFVLNVALLVNITRILLTTFKQSSVVDVHQYRKTVRAVATLTPLFGITYFLTFYRPPCNAPGFHQYQSVNSLLEGAQGFFVALFFCYLNDEVHECIKLSIKRRYPNKTFFTSHQQRMSLSTRATEVSCDYKLDSLPRNTTSGKHDDGDDCDDGDIVQNESATL